MKERDELCKHWEELKHEVLLSIEKVLVPILKCLNKALIRIGEWYEYYWS